jgi:hypothetical protein
MKNSKEWYTTPEEFSDIVSHSVFLNSGFVLGQSYHPEDLAVAFSNAARSVALGLSYAAHKEQKRAMMQTGGLRKAQS